MKNNQIFVEGASPPDWMQAANEEMECLESKIEEEKHMYKLPDGTKLSLDPQGTITLYSGGEEISIDAEEALFVVVPLVDHLLMEKRERMRAQAQEALMALREQGDGEGVRIICTAFLKAVERG
ncbi:hypothetical protein ACTHPH_21630 [Paenibacillus pasadenensis]|uniref:hypothetical protein n=1 Tax=Paenibacillus pasadenensis TaxID=217090 RepID=UPI00048C2036|nr:hypothetical protein [Paenibacillus pasadenensis]